DALATPSGCVTARAPSVLAARPRRAQALGLRALLLGGEPPLLRAAGRPGGPAGAGPRGERVRDERGEPGRRGSTVAALLAVLRGDDGEDPVGQSRGEPFGEALSLRVVQHG